MMSKKKGILNAVFLITVFAITIYAIFHGQDLGELFGYIRNTDYRYWLVAVVCVVFFICSESVIIYYMMRSIRQKIKLMHCFLYTCAGMVLSGTFIKCLLCGIYDVSGFPSDTGS